MRKIPNFESLNSKDNYIRAHYSKWICDDCNEQINIIKTKKIEKNKESSKESTDQSSDKQIYTKRRNGLSNLLDKWNKSYGINNNHNHNSDKNITISSDPTSKDEILLIFE